LIKECSKDPTIMGGPSLHSFSTCKNFGVNRGRALDMWWELDTYRIKKDALGCGHIIMSKFDPGSTINSLIF